MKRRGVDGPQEKEGIFGYKKRSSLLFYTKL